MDYRLRGNDTAEISQLSIVLSIHVLTCIDKFVKLQIMSLSTFNPELCHNEREVESKLLVSYLLPILGYSPETWRQEMRSDRFRLDFVASTSQDHNTPHLVLEAKHPTENLNDHFEQLRNYMQKLKIKYGLLTNGREIRIYEAKSNNSSKKLSFHPSINNSAFSHFSIFRKKYEEKLNANIKK